VNAKDEIEKIRRMIDNIDEQLVELIIKRMNCSREIGEYKKTKHLPIYDLQREEEIIRAKIELFIEHGFNDPIFVQKLFFLFFEKSREMQQ